MTSPDLTPDDGIDKRDSHFAVKITRCDGTVLETDARRKVNRYEFTRALDDAVSIELGPGALPPPLRVGGERLTGAVVGTLIFAGMGTVVGGIIGPFLAAGGPTVVGSILIVWIRQRKSDFKLKITRKDGTVLEVEAKRVARSDGLADQINAAIADATSIQISPGGAADLPELSE